MSHYHHQYQQQQHQFQQQQHPQMYKNDSTSYQQQQQPQMQPQYEQPQQPAMTYNNNLQVPVMFSMSSSIQGYNTAPTDLGCEQTYFQGMGMTMSQDASSNCTTNNNGNICPPSLISIRRDSGFAPSLDELSLGIMASDNNQDREDFKGVLHTLQETAAFQSSMMSSGIVHNDNSSSSFFISSPTSPSTSSSSSPSTAAIINTYSSSASPVVPSMPVGIEYPLVNEQRQFLQVQQQHLQGSAAATIVAAVGDAHSSPSSPCTTSTWSTDFSMMSSQQHQQQPTLLSPLQYHPRQGQIQRPRQRKPMLHIMTSTESEQQAMMFNSSMSPMSATWESSSVAPMAASPSMSAANNIVRAGQYQQQQSQKQSNYPWGFVSSPVESSFSSGSSTPLFASPSSSYTQSDMVTSSSCQSSRAASPSFAPSSLYENFLTNERRIKRRNSECSNLIIRSRKSSTSSTSSIVSQRRASTLRESALTPSSPSTANHSGCSNPAPATSTSTGTHQCPKCGQRFAGPAVLVRHIESIHDKLLWNCVGCKSNLSRRDAVTRHINLSPMDSICRAVGTIGQIKTSNGAEVHYEISSYRAKPLDEVMNRMGKKISTTLRKEIDRSKAAALQQQQQQQQQHSQQYHPYQHQYQAMMMEDIEMLQEHGDMMEDELTKKRRRPSMVVDEALLGCKKKM
ncbi:hypothetical protein BKA57DRAFT_504958 [Linnemannia elongata]|nr:hypothetical protein BKA57DRAFT_504958 [Linnemannia elongata]